MTYSCAYFARRGETLEEAQEAKLELVCTKLRLARGRARPRRRLRVGQLRDPRRHPPRRQRGRRHAVRASGASWRASASARPAVADRVEIRVADYRELADGPFDAISSIGMVEHVGEERIDLYAEPAGRPAAARRPAAQPRDRQAPGLRHQGRGRRSRSGSCSPTGCRCRSRGSCARSSGPGSSTTHVEGLPPTTRETSTALDRVASRSATRTRCGSPAIERARIWRLYLRAARQGFTTGWASVYQVLGTAGLRPDPRDHDTSRCALDRQGG